MVTGTNESNEVGQNVPDQETCGGRLTFETGRLNAPTHPDATNFQYGGMSFATWQETRDHIESLGNEVTIVIDQLDGQTFTIKGPEVYPLTYTIGRANYTKDDIKDRPVSLVKIVCQEPDIRFAWTDPACYTWREGRTEVRGYAQQKFDAVSGEFIEWVILNGTGPTDPTDLKSLTPCEPATVTCFKSKSVNVGIENTGTNFAEGYTIRVDMSDGSFVDVTTTPQTGWLNQVQHWADQFAAAFPDMAVDMRHNPLPGTAPNLAFTQPRDGVVWTNMRYLYVDLLGSVGGVSPIGATITESPQNAARIGLQLLLDVVDTPELRGWQCVIKNEPVDLFTYDWTLIPVRDRPTRVFDCAEAFPETPGPLCSSTSLAGCDNNNEADPANFISDIVQVITTCEGRATPTIAYFAPDPASPDDLISYTLVGDFVNCDGTLVEEPIPGPFYERDLCLQTALGTKIYATTTYIFDEFGCRQDIKTQAIDANNNWVDVTGTPIPCPCFDDPDLVYPLPAPNPPPPNEVNNTQADAEADVNFPNAIRGICPFNVNADYSWTVGGGFDYPAGNWFSSSFTYGIGESYTTAVVDSNGAPVLAINSSNSRGSFQLTLPGVYTVTIARNSTGACDGDIVLAPTTIRIV